MRLNGMCPICYIKKLLVPLKRTKDINIADKYDNNAALTPPMGWSSWNTFKNIIDQEVIYDTAVALKETGLLDAGYEYINIDDNWASSSRDENGYLIGDKTRFADGIPSLVEKINALGIKVGIYSSNGTLTCEDLPASLGNEFKDALTIADWGIEYFKYDFCHNQKVSKYAPLIYGITLSKSGDRKESFYPVTDAKLSGYAKLMKRKSSPIGVCLTGLDGNIGIAEYEIEIETPGSYTFTIDICKKGGYKKYLQVLINDEDTYEIDIPPQKKWNNTARFQTTVTFKKGVNTIKLYNPIRTKIDSAILQYRTMADAIKKASENTAKKNNQTIKPIVFSICEWGFRKPWLWGKTAGNLWRTTPDIRPIWPWIMTIYSRNVKLYKYAEIGAWNDPDMLEVGNGNLTEAENKTHFSLWCMMNAPLILGNDLRKITPEILNIVTNKHMININQDALGKQAKRIDSGWMDILAKPLANGDIAVCFANKFGGKKKASLALTPLKKDNYLNFQDALDTVKVYDVWENTTYETSKLIVEVEKHGCKVLILSKDLNKEF
ncbi:MAG TPA: alpha-galactosidase [Clostridia bacterium]|jgi:hypothetical protein|nr:alpha-galactosidase [Clostridia bacterium]